MDLATIKKALVAAVGAGLAAAVGVLTKAGKLDQATVGQALGAFAVAAFAVGWATWKARNAPTSR